MEPSILNSTKKVLGVEPEYDAFDEAIVMHINTVFSTLNQMGIGPDLGFAIEDAGPVWDDFLHDDLRLNNIKTYMHLRVRLLFDPPQTSFHMAAIKEQIEELEVRLSIQREGTAWTDPTTPPLAPLL